MIKHDELTTQTIDKSGENPKTKQHLWIELFHFSGINSVEVFRTIVRLS